MPRRRTRPAAPATMLTLATIATHGILGNAAAQETPVVEVVGTTPLPGIGTPIRDVPANVQVFRGREIERQGQPNVADYLEENPTSVTINSAQGNPFQADINYRGFTASPLLGTPQGISVFQDGVRINEPFGDVVNWDLLPPSAIGSIQLIPGSVPAFGLNTLGGALAVQTRNGRNNPGGSVELYGGSFGRTGATLTHGGSQGKLDYFFTANALEDDGWAEHNRSRIRQAFGKLGWRDDKTEADVSLTLADNRLEGIQALPVSFLNNIRQPYTYPDTNTNNLAFLTAKGNRFLSDSVILGANAYYRKYRNENVSSNVNDDFEPGSDESAALNDRSNIDQDSYGFGAQLTLLGKLAGRENQLVIGASGDFGHARFTQDSQAAIFTAGRGAEGIGGFERETDALTRNRYLGLFFSDTLKLSPEWTLTVSGRYNHAKIRIEDRSGEAPELDGKHTFSRFNPAVGINYSPSPRLTAYAGYNEGMRVPTPIELTCADPAAPCKLPNNFLADPPLKKVVSRTGEAGARGTLGSATQWSAAVYRTELSDDIQFISAGGTSVNAGFFQNVGKTRRQGIELSLGTKFDGLGLSARYSLVDATFQSTFSVHSPNNSSADADGNIQVRPGNRIPGIPRHSLKLRADYDWQQVAGVGVNVVLSSRTYARGDENNRDGNGQVPGYAVVNLDAHYRPVKNIEIFARVVNLFDRKYANFAVLGENFFTGPGGSFDAASARAEQFRGIGSPRGGWIGLRYEWI
jgi:iron complex outermembrane recepter protein